ncbi:MAG: hypothetical protein ACLT1W_12300 [Alistipes onderdonkii]
MGRDTLGAWIFALPVMVISMVFMHMPYGEWIMLALTLPVLALFGRAFFVNGWKQTSHRTANMDTLVAPAPRSPSVQSFHALARILVCTRARTACLL